MNLWLMVGLGWIVMGLVMAFLWLLQRKTGDAGIVDVAWGMGVGFLTLFFVWGSHDGDLTRRIVLAVLALAWALRLSGYILWRVLTMPEDGRYQTLKQNWGYRRSIEAFLVLSISGHWQSAVCTANADRRTGNCSAGPV